MLNFSLPKRTPAARKWPSARQWRSFFKVLSKRERVIFFTLFAVFLVSLVFLSTKFYLSNTEIRPSAGGTLIEGVVGQPRFINPIYASSNDVDRDLSELIFSGIMKYDENGGLVYDLAKNVQPEEDDTAYRIFLKDDVVWSDSVSASAPFKVTADDIVFTIKIIQDPEYKSSLRADWVNVTVEKVNDHEVVFRLKNPYAAFLENLTVKILPQHIWQTVSASNFALSSYNQYPIGSGPYKLESISQDNSGHVSSLLLKANNKYFAEGKPYISEIKFKFFENEEGLVKAAKGGEINSFALSGDGNHTDPLKNLSLDEHSLDIPRYFAVFFNPNQNKALSDLKVRQALNYGTNKEEIVNLGLNSQAKIVDSPILPDFFGFQNPSQVYEFNAQKAKSLLDEAGFTETDNGMREKTIEKKPAFQFKSTLQTGSTGAEVRELQACLAKYPDIYPEGEITGVFGDKTKAAVIRFQETYADEILKPSGLTKGTGVVAGSTRKKLNALCEPATQEITPLKITLTTVNQSELLTVANLLKNQWKLLGVNVEIKTFDGSSVQETNDIIKTRSYEALLYGESLGSIPDPFPFWDSIQVKDPGLNLAAYENEDADKLLENARQTLNPQERESKLEDFQNILIADAPAVFLYSPGYIYFTPQNVHNVAQGLITDPSKRFSNIENWYIKTKRVLK